MFVTNESLQENLSPHLAVLGLPWISPLLYKRGSSAPITLPLSFPAFATIVLVTLSIDQPLRNQQGAPKATAMAGTGSPPCASCKLLRRRCSKECVFAPYFPPEDPHKFAIVHKVFGASNVSKMLQELPAQQRADAVSSLVYEASARMRDPVYGCVGAISYLQQQVSQLQMQLAVAQAEILCIQTQHDGHDGQTPAAALQQVQQQQQEQLQMDGKAYNNLIMHNGLMNTLSSTAAHHQLMGFGSAGSTAMMLQEACLKKESLWT